MERTPPRYFFNTQQPYPSPSRGRVSKNYGFLRPYTPNQVTLQPYVPLVDRNNPLLSQPFLPYRQNDSVNKLNVHPKENIKTQNFNAQNNCKKKKDGKGQAHPLPEVKLTETTFYNQCLEMIECIQMTENETQWKEIVLNDVANVFRRVLPGVIPQMYGSSVTGIAFNTSDFDVHLHTHGETDQDFIKKYGGFVYRSTKFTETIKVARARVPVVKTKHICGIELDISATSQDAVYNSILIKFLMESDTRIRHLTMLISYWSKRNNIAGRNLFTSYSIVLLVIFYLQRTDPPLLPPMKDLLYQREKYAWPYALRNDAKLSSHTNSSSFSSLFLGFFNFYHKKDFSKVVLSTYLGKEIPTGDFDNLETLSDDFKHYKRQIAMGKLPIEISLIQVQDPIELNVNTTKCVYPRLFKLFEDSIHRFVTETSILPMENWLIKITTEQPLSMKKVMKNYFFSVPYKKEGDNWRENFALDFKTVCAWLLFEIKDVNTNKYQKVDEQVKKKVTSQYDYNIRTTCNIFTKRNKPAIKLLINGISPEEFSKKIKTGNQCDPVDFKAGVSINLDFEKVPHPNDKVDNTEKKVEFKDRIRIEFTNLNENPSNDNFAQIVHGFALHFNSIVSIVIKTRMGLIEKKVEPEKTSKKKKKSKAAQNKVQLKTDFPPLPKPQEKCTQMDLEKTSKAQPNSSGDTDKPSFSNSSLEENAFETMMQIDLTQDEENDFPHLTKPQENIKFGLEKALNVSCRNGNDHNTEADMNKSETMMEIDVKKISPNKPQMSTNDDFPPPLSSPPKGKKNQKFISPKYRNNQPSLSNSQKSQKKPESDILPPRPISSKFYEEKKALTQNLGISGPSNAITLTSFKHNAETKKPFKDVPHINDQASEKDAEIVGLNYRIVKRRIK